VTPFTATLPRGPECDEGHGDVTMAATPGAAGGRGLRVVDELADSWGARKGSTRVWFRVLL
jgi:hypothetical protein